VRARGKLVERTRRAKERVEDKKACIAVAGLLVSSLIVTASFRADAQQKKSSNEDSGFALTYTRTGQITTEITISRSELTRTVTTCHTPGSGQSCENPTSESKTAQLSAEDVKKLKKDIQSFGFQKLYDTYGTPNFSYPRTISVTIEGITKSVVYRGGSDASPAPAAFVSVEDLIGALESTVLTSNQRKTALRHLGPGKISDRSFKGWVAPAWTLWN